MAMSDGFLKQYKIAEIAVDEDGMCWIHYLGDHAEQGGIAFKWGNFGCESLEDLLKAATKLLPKHEDEYQKLIKDKKD